MLYDWHDISSIVSELEEGKLKEASVGEKNIGLLKTAAQVTPAHHYVMVGSMPAVISFARCTSTSSTLPMGTTAQVRATSSAPSP
jgi:hypothetical protein